MSRMFGRIALVLVVLLALPMLATTPSRAQQPVILRVLDEGPQVGPWAK